MDLLYILDKYEHARRILLNVRISDSCARIRVFSREESEAMQDLKFFHNFNGRAYFLAYYCSIA